jgi:quercetin dioxygenase-like cupin family protein
VSPVADVAKRHRRRAAAAAKLASVFRPARSFRWKGVRREDYKAAGEQWAGIARYVLFAGSRGSAIAFDVRYFEIDEGGHSTLEKHRHAHVVIGLRGVGRIRIGSRWRHLKPFDSCYIGPDAPHQLRNDGSEPFGFLCVVDARRDRGRPLPRARGRREPQ